jgi:hypothetical protein
MDTKPPDPGSSRLAIVHAAADDGAFYQPSSSSPQHEEDTHRIMTDTDVERGNVVVDHGDADGSAPSTSAPIPQGKQVEGFFTDVDGYFRVNGVNFRLVGLIVLVIGTRSHWNETPIVLGL